MESGAAYASANGTPMESTGFGAVLLYVCLEDLEFPQGLTVLFSELYLSTVGETLVYAGGLSFDDSDLSEGISIIFFSSLIT